MLAIVRRLVRLRCSPVAAALALVLFGSVPLRAQSADRSAAVAGYVIVARGDSVVQPVPDAEVTLLSTGQSARTTSDGAYHIDRAPSGRQLVRLRRLGFAPLVVQLELHAGEIADLDARLAPAAVGIDSVIVRGILAAREPAYVARLRRNAGYFVTQAEIDAHPTLRDAGDVVIRLPGVRIDRLTGVAYATRNERNTIYGRPCGGMAVFVDGTEIAGDFDVRSVPAKQVAAVEVYDGPATVPLELRSAENATCGVLAIWTR